MAKGATSETIRVDVPFNLCASRCKAKQPLFLEIIAMSKTTVQLPSGATIEIQTTDPFVGSAGVTEASPLDKLTKQNWEDVMQRVAEVANDAITSLRDKIKPCKGFQLNSESA